MTVPSFPTISMSIGAVIGGIVGGVVTKSWKGAAYGAIIGAILAAAIYTIAAYWPQIVNAIKGAFQALKNFVQAIKNDIPGHAHDRTVSNGLWRKICERFSTSDPTNAQKLEVFQEILDKPFGGARLFGSGVLGWIQKIFGLWQLLTPAGRAAYAKWFNPTAIAGWCGIGAVAALVVVLVIIIVIYWDDLKLLHDSLKATKENEEGRTMIRN